MDEINVKLTLADVRVAIQKAAIEKMNDLSLDFGKHTWSYVGQSEQPSGGLCVRMKRVVPVAAEVE